MADFLPNIQRFVVLMLENRSFDHLLGNLKSLNPAIDGVTGSEFSNFPDPNNPQPPAVTTGPATGFAMPFDPPHEF